MARIRIGTSGWSYPHWRGCFYPRSLPQAEWLSFYAERFSTVELNTTFYRLPNAESVAAWREATPPDFLFAAKVSRYVSHMKRLKDPAETLSRFLERVEGLGSKLGPLLVQLPPHWTCNEERLRAFLQAAGKGHRFAVELRNESWWSESVETILRANGSALCLFHLAGVWSPKVETADFVYFRLHGPGDAYSGRYDAVTLRRVADWCRDWRARNLDVFGYFDNDESAHAAANAAELIDLIGDCG